MTPSPSDLAVLRYFAGCIHATVPAIGAACGIAPNHLRPRLAALESHRLVSSRQDTATRPPQRIAYATAEGRRAAGMNDARATT